MTIALLAFAHPRLEAHVNLAVHLDRLARSLPEEERALRTWSQRAAAGPPPSPFARFPGDLPRRSPLSSDGPTPPLSVVVHSWRQLRSALAGLRLETLYVVAHASRAGLHLPQDVVTPAQWQAALTALAAAPQLLVLACCDPQRHGLLAASFAAGVPLVWAPRGTVTISAALTSPFSLQPADTAPRGDAPSGHERSRPLTP